MDGSVIVAYLGLDKPANVYFYYIDLVYGWDNLFLPYGYYDLAELSAFKNLIALFKEPLDCGYYYLFDIIPLNILALSFANCVVLPGISTYSCLSPNFVTLYISQFDYGLNMY